MMFASMVAAQDLKEQLERAENLCAVLHRPSASMAAVVAGSSIPRAVLQLALLLERAGSAEAANQVSGACLLAWSRLVPHNFVEALGAVCLVHLLASRPHVCRLYRYGLE